MFEKLKSLTTSDKEKIKQLDSNFFNIFKRFVDQNPDNVNLLTKLFELSNRYKKLSDKEKRVYWRMVGVNPIISTLESAFKLVEDFMRKQALITDKNSPQRSYHDSLLAFFNPTNDQNEGAKLDAEVNTIKHLEELEGLRSSVNTNAESKRIINIFNLITGNFPKLNSVRILRESRIANELVKNKQNVSEKIILDILIDLKILPSQVDVHIQAFEKLKNLSNLPADLLKEKDDFLKSPNAKSHYVSFLLYLESTVDLRKKEYKFTLKDPLSGVEFDSEYFLKNNTHLPNVLLKIELDSVRVLFDLLKKSSVSNDLKDKIRNIIESGQNYEHGLLLVQQQISRYNNSNLGPEEIIRVERLNNNLNPAQIEEIIDHLKLISTLQDSVKNIVIKFLSKNSSNAKDVYNESKILKDLYNKCYIPKVDNPLRLEITTLLASNLKPSEIKKRLGL